jgi:hypothetical protein
VAKFTDEDDALLEELGVQAETKRASIRTAREARIIAGFEEILRFVELHGRAPQHGEDSDIFERLYAVRLDRLGELAECRALLEPLDHQGLLAVAKSARPIAADMDDEALLAELGAKDADHTEITELRHVRSAADKKAAEEIANRQKSEDFKQFKPLFDEVQRELKDGLRHSRPRTRLGEGSPTPSPAPYSRIEVRKAILRAAPSMFSAASPKTPSSRSIGTFCTRSA